MGSRSGRGQRDRLVRGSASGPIAGGRSWSGWMQTATSLVTSLVAVVALAYSGQALQATRDQLRITEQGQVTERYSRAIDPPADIQAALTVLGRRDPRHDGTTRIDLQRTDLAGADLGGARLAGAYLSRTNVRKAYLHEADLGGAWLHDTDLSEADLSGADLRDAFLGGADLVGADLSTARGMTPEQLKCLRRIDGRTRLPSGIASPALDGRACE